MKISELLDKPRESYLCQENSLLDHVKNSYEEGRGFYGYHC